MSEGKRKVMSSAPRPAAILVLFLTLCLLPGCGSGSAVPSDTGTDGPATEFQTAPDPVPAPDTQPYSPPPGATDAELRAYYEELIATLRQDLLSERLDRYISDYDYETRLAQLEQELALLQAGAELESTQSVGGHPTNPPEQNTAGEADTDADPGPTMAFRYGIVGGSAVIYEYLGDSRTVSVPRVIDGYSVTMIADCAFQNSHVTSVILPDSVTSVGWFAFAGCASLQTVTLPASVTTISYAAFDGCPSLTVLCTQGSYAARWAASYGLQVQYI